MRDAQQHLQSAGYVPRSTLRQRTRRSRRGSNLVEFVLLLPLFLAFLSAVFDFSWFFFTQAVAQSSVRDGCRTGSIISPDDDPETEARTTIADNMASFPFMGVDCGAATGARCDVEVTTSGASPNEVIECSITIDYPGLTGLIPMPETVQARSTARFESQR